MGAGTGWDGMGAETFKTVKYFILEPLKYLINLSLKIIYFRPC